MRELSEEAQSPLPAGGPVQRDDVHVAAAVSGGSIIEAIGHAIVVVDGLQRIEACNQRFRDVFQLDAGAWFRAPLADAIRDDGLEDAIARRIATGEESRELEFNCRIGGDEERCFLLSISKIGWTAAADCTIVMLDEVTEWKRRQAQVAESLRVVAVNEIVAGITHEINNPMAAVMGFSQLILKRDLVPEVRRDVESILEQAQRCAKIVSSLRSFAGQSEPTKGRVSATEILLKVLDSITCRLRANNIDVVTEFQPSTPPVLGDSHQLERAFLNIVINAQESMIEGGEGGTLTIEVSTRNGNVRIAFTDDGPGIDKEILPKVFDPFFTTKEVGRGTGLGLSYTLSVVRDHGGTIDADSVAGRGATFTIELPGDRTPDSS